MTESSSSPLKFSTKLKRKESNPLDKENQHTFKSHNSKSKRLCLGTLSTNIEQAESQSVTKYSEMWLSQCSQDSHDSGFSNFSSSQSQSQSSPKNYLNESIGVEADMDMLNDMCIQSSASNNRILNFTNSPSSSPMPTRRCLFNASPKIQTPKTQNQCLFTDSSYTTKHETTPKRNITPVSINRSIIPNTMDSPSFSNIVEQSITSIQKMLERKSNPKHHRTFKCSFFNPEIFLIN